VIHFHSKKTKEETSTTQRRGALYEKCAMAYCRRKGLKIIAKNLRLSRGEVDCLAWDAKKNYLVILEVRGRASSKYRPSRFISKKKLEKLKSLGRLLVVQHRCSVRIFLLEVTGELPKRYLLWGLEYFPEKLGLTLRAFEVL